MRSLTLSRAIESGQFYILERDIRALRLPVPLMRKFYHELKIGNIATLAFTKILRLKELGLAPRELGVIRRCLRRCGLDLEMVPHWSLTDALVLRRDLDLQLQDQIVCSLMRYSQQRNVSVRTRFLIEHQRDLARERIEQHRREQSGFACIHENVIDEAGLRVYRINPERPRTRMSIPIGTNADGTTQWHNLGLMF